MAAETLEISYRNAPGNRWDWIGITSADEKVSQHYLGFASTDAGIDGTGTIETAPLAESLVPGTYRVLLLEDDGYVIRAETLARYDLRPDVVATRLRVRIAIARCCRSGLMRLGKGHVASRLNETGPSGVDRDAGDLVPASRSTSPI